MLKFLTLKEEAFGLDINDLSLKIVNLKKKSNALDLVSSNLTEIKPGIIEEGIIKNEEALIKIIKTACAGVNGKKLNTKYVVASLPEEKSFLQVIQMPRMKEEELMSAVPLQAENYIPLPVNDIYLDFQTIAPVKNYLSYIDVQTVAMPKKIVDSYFSCLKKAGLIPLAMEAESQGIVRALIKKGADTPPLILVDFGKNNTDFIIFSSNAIRFTSSIPVSSQQLTESISKNLKIDFNKAEKLKTEYGLAGKDDKAKKILQAMTPILNNLMAQIQKYLNFYNDPTSRQRLALDEEIKKILLCGGGANLKGLPEFLSKNLGIPAELGNPCINFSSKKTNGAVKEKYLFFTTAIGLALREKI